MPGITIIGIDVSGNVFRLHGIDEKGKMVLRTRLNRSKTLEFFKRLPPCVIGMVACGVANFWARKLSGMGHRVRLITRHWVRPYLPNRSGDDAVAEAICGAASDPATRFSDIKPEDR